MEAILISVAVLCLAAALILVMISAQRKKAISELNIKLSEIGQQLRESRIQFEAKCKEVDEARSKLDRTRDEAKKAKKRAFDLEQQDKEKTVVPQVAMPQDEDALLEARAQARQAMDAAARTNEDKNYALEQIEKLKGELATAKQTLRSRHEDALKAERGESERTKKLDSELVELQEKLELARRKARTDAQVYRITKSKLDLALEKIARLEHVLGNTTSNPPSEAPLEAAISAPLPIGNEPEALLAPKTNNTPN
jgi:hypothetical protein